MVSFFWFCSVSFCALHVAKWAQMEPNRFWRRSTCRKISIFNFFLVFNFFFLGNKVHTAVPWWLFFSPSLSIRVSRISSPSKPIFPLSTSFSSSFFSLCSVSERHFVSLALAKAYCMCLQEPSEPHRGAGMALARHFLLVRCTRCKKISKIRENFQNFA